jgi:hypothetical protein
MELAISNQKKKYYEKKFLPNRVLSFLKKIKIFIYKTFQDWNVFLCLFRFLFLPSHLILVPVTTDAAILEKLTI